MNVFTREWWDAAGTRAANTAIAALLPLVALLVSGQSSPLYALSMVALSAVGSILTSMAGLPEVDGKTIPLWRAVLVRSVKTLGQVGVPALGSVLLIQDVDWKAFAVLVGGATLTTVLRTLKDYLPETLLPASGVVVTSPAVVSNVTIVNGPSTSVTASAPAEAVADPGAGVGTTTL